MQKIIVLSALLFPALCFADICPTESIEINPVGALFGSYTPTSDDDSTVGTIELSCAIPGDSVSAIVTAMPGSSHNYATRQMINGPYRMNYNLYRDPAYTQIWGDGTNGTFPVCGVCSVGDCTATIQIYGFIPTGQSLIGAGSYTDSIEITATSIPTC